MSVRTSTKWGGGVSLAGIVALLAVAGDYQIPFIPEKRESGQVVELRRALEKEENRTARLEAKNEALQKAVTLLHKQGQSARFEFEELFRVHAANSPDAAPVMPAVAAQTAKLAEVLNVKLDQTTDPARPSVVD